MFGIYKYESGLKFTGWIARTEKEAWNFLDKKYGFIYEGENLGCNHNAFEVIRLKNVRNFKE